MNEGITKAGSREQTKLQYCDLKREDQRCELSKQVLYINNSTRRYNIAVTSSQGSLVDQSCIAAVQFQIYHVINDSFTLAEVRLADKKGSSKIHEKENIITTLADCDALLTLGIGRVLQKKLLNKGVLVLEYCYTVESGLIYAAAQLDRKKVI